MSLFFIPFICFPSFESMRFQGRIKTQKTTDKLWSCQCWSRILCRRCKKESQGLSMEKQERLEPGRAWNTWLMFDDSWFTIMIIYLSTKVGSEIGADLSLWRSLYLFHRILWIKLLLFVPCKSSRRRTLSQSHYSSVVLGPSLMLILISEFVKLLLLSASEKCSNHEMSIILNRNKTGIGLWEASVEMENHQ